MASHKMSGFFGTKQAQICGARAIYQKTIHQIGQFIRQDNSLEDNLLEDILLEDNSLEDNSLDGQFIRPDNSLENM